MFFIKVLSQFFIAKCFKKSLLFYNILILKNMVLHERRYKEHQIPTEEYCYSIKFQVYFKNQITNTIKLRQN